MDIRKIFVKSQTQRILIQFQCNIILNINIKKTTLQIVSRGFMQSSDILLRSYLLFLFTFLFISLFTFLFTLKVAGDLN